MKDDHEYFYIPNGAFIKAADELGYEYRRLWPKNRYPWYNSNYVLFRMDFRDDRPRLLSWKWEDKELSPCNLGSQ